MGSKPIIRPMFTGDSAPHPESWGLRETRASLDARPPRRVLVIGRANIGELVNTSGALHQIVQRFPGAEITVDAGAAALGILKGFPGVAGFLPRPRRRGLLGKLKYVLDLRRRNFDLALILDEANEKVLLASLGGVGRIVGVRKSKYFGKFLGSVPFSEEGHDLFDSLAGVLHLIGAEPDLRPRLFPSPEHAVEADHALASAGVVRGAIGLFVGASDARKQWPPERFQALADLLAAQGRQVLVFGGPGEEAAVRSAAGPHPKLESPLSLLGLVCLVERLGAVATGDTGVAHIAAAVDTPAAILYGPTRPGRYHPFPGRQALLHRGFACDHYAHVCMEGPYERTCSHSCMAAITVADVAEALNALLSPPA